MGYHLQKDEVVHADVKRLADLMLDILDLGSSDVVLLVLEVDEEGCWQVVAWCGLLDDPSWLLRYDWFGRLRDYRDSSHLEVVRLAFWDHVYDLLVACFIFDSESFVVIDDLDVEILVFDASSHETFFLELGK